MKEFDFLTELDHLKESDIIVVHEGGTNIDFWYLFKNGGQLSDGYMDDLRIMIESIYPKPIRKSSSESARLLMRRRPRFTSPAA